MKNNCDVSGLYAECRGEKTCIYVEKDHDCIYLSGYGTICNNLAAIRAAIEAERKEQRAELAALKKDALIVSNLCIASHCEIEIMGYNCPCEFCSAARRIISATKEEP